MIKKLSEITDAVFENIPRSRKTEEARVKIDSALESEYKRLRESGRSEMQAVGELMYRYSTLDEAEKLAGIDPDELDVDTEQISADRKTFKKVFGKIRFHSILAAWFLCTALTCVYHGILSKAPLHMISMTINCATAAAALVLYRKRSRSLSFDCAAVAPQFREGFAVYCDRYRKRLINSIFLLLALTVVYLSAFEHSIVANMNGDELIVLLISNTYIMTIGLLILFKNVLYVRFISGLSLKEDAEAYRKYCIKVLSACGIFLAAALSLTAILRIFVKDPFPLLYIMTGLFIAAGAALNYRSRRTFIKKNLRLNKIRTAAFSTAFILLFSVATMRKENYVLQPYIISISQVEHTEHDISYDDGSGVYTISADEGDFKILHLTDIHLGGSVNSSVKDYKAMNACYKLIENTNPDLVVVTGDLVFPMGIMSLSLNNEAPVSQFASFMRNVGIPWAFTYGNHDTEYMATGDRETIDLLYQSLSFKSSGNLLYPYVQPDITGRSNQLIKIENTDGSIRQALFLIDSNDYTGTGINDYDFIHDDQVDWYAEQVRELSREQGETVPSMLFFHIPLQQYRTAYQLYEQGSSDVKYFFGENNESMMDKVCCSDYPSKLFDTAAELGSTKAMFCGHDHYNNISLEYQGIRLTYGMSIDYLAMPGIDKDTEQRGGELITIRPDSSFDIRQIKLTDIE